jgi:predicted cobalt transporter CbtA
MVRSLLVRGMLAGVLAGLLVFAFARVFGEPAVDRAIGFEAALHEAEVRADLAKGLPAPVEEPELVSRAVQASVGLLTGVAVYATAFGGLFALVFAAAFGRIGALGPRAVSALLAAGGFVAVYLVPNLKYPANPPAIGEPGTIGIRTALYFLMLLVSIAAMAGAVLLRQRLLPRHGGWNASLAAAGLYLAAVIIAGAWVLPPVNEVPAGFPADVLWNFRVAALGMQAVMWGTIGLVFGWLAERAMAPSDERTDRPFRAPAGIANR